MQGHFVGNWMTISVRKKLRFSETRWELECQQLFINVLLWSKAITWTLLTIIVNNYRHAYIMVKSKMNIEHSLDHKSDLIVPCCMGLQKCHVFGCDMWCQCQCWHLTWHCKTSPARCHLLHSLSTFQCQPLLRNVTIEQAADGPHNPAAAHNLH